MKTTKSTKSMTQSTNTVANTTVANSKSFNIKCAVVNGKPLPLVKALYNGEIISVSVPVDFRRCLEQGMVFNLDCHLSADGRFLVAENLGKTKAKAAKSDEPKVTKKEALEKEVAALLA